MWVFVTSLVDQPVLVILPMKEFLNIYKYLWLEALFAQFFFCSFVKYYSNFIVLLLYIVKVLPFIFLS